LTHVTNLAPRILSSLLDLLETMLTPWLRITQNNVVIPLINHSISRGVTCDVRKFFFRHFKTFPKELSKYKSKIKFIKHRSFGLAFMASLIGMCHLCSSVHAPSVVVKLTHSVAECRQEYRQ